MSMHTSRVGSLGFHVFDGEPDLGSSDRKSALRPSFEENCSTSAYHHDPSGDHHANAHLVVSSREGNEQQCSSSIREYR